MMEIRPAGPEDLGAIRTLLAVCLLPMQDIAERQIRFVVAESDRGIIGVGGLEVLPEGVALLRSVAVMPGYRKQNVGRRIVNRLVSMAQDEHIDRIYLLTETASDYFGAMGFSAVARDKVPAQVAATPQFSRLCSRNATLMVRDTKAHPAAEATRAFAEVGEAAQAQFDAGYYCAESVLMAVADRAGIHSPLLPAIATGFCNGVARTWGTCGALSGGVMAVNLAFGRKSPGEPVGQNYAAVRKLIDEFGKSCGALNCSELLACDLDTKDGRRLYEEHRLKNHCREYVGTAARIAASLVQQKIDLRGDEGSSDRAEAA
jgi:C_GCAxxG_C_C family probable redox protein